MSGPLSIDVFWSFRSPWSYLATPRLRDWKARYRLEIRFRPVYPLAVRTPEFFERVHPLWLPYFMRDLQRVAEYLALPCVWPRPDPVASRLTPDGVVYLPEQPRVERLTRLGVLAEEQGRGIEFADELARLIWGGTQDWDQGEHLARAAERAGCDLAAMDARAVSERDRIEAVIAQSQADHEAAGHWGVPTCAFRGEPFFGQDRLDILLWRLRQHGLEERHAD